MSWPAFDPLQSANAWLEVVAASHASAEGIERLQARRLRELLTAAAARSPLYRSILGASPSRVALRDLPVASKSMLMRDFDRWVADPALRLHELQARLHDPQAIGQACGPGVIAWESSGSSGVPGVFVQDARAMAVYDALEAARGPLSLTGSAWDGAWHAGRRIAFVGAIGGHFASIVSVQRLRRLNPWFAACSHCLSFMQPMPALVDELNACRPDVIATYPTVAWLLAQEHEAGRLKARPAQFWTGGETLTPAMRRGIVAAFGGPARCTVRDSYGASEFLTIASECRFGRLHLNADWVILEPVHADGRAAGPGETGETVLLTNLANHVQPLVRYDLGDRVAFAEGPCGCGSALPVIHVQGRSDGVLRLKDRRGRTVSIVPLALATALEEEAGVFDFRLVPRDDRSVLLHLGGNDATAAKVRKAREVLQAFLAAQGLPDVSVHADAKGRGPPARSGKHARFCAAASRRIGA